MTTTEGIILLIDNFINNLEIIGYQLEKTKQGAKKDDIMGIVIDNIANKYKHKMSEIEMTDLSAIVNSNLIEGMLKYGQHKEIPLDCETCPTKDTCTALKNQTHKFESEILKNITDKECNEIIDRYNISKRI